MFNSCGTRTDDISGQSRMCYQLSHPGSPNITRKAINFLRNQYWYEDRLMNVLDKFGSGPDRLPTVDSGLHLRARLQDENGWHFTERFIIIIIIINLFL